MKSSSFFLAKTKSSYHLISENTWSPAFDSMEKKYVTEIAKLKLAVQRLTKK